MRPISIGKRHPVIAGQCQSPTRIGNRHHLGSRNAVRVKLIVPTGVKRIGPINPLAVTADLNHLGPPRARLAIRMRRPPRDAANMDRACEFRPPRIAHVVLPHLASSPAGDIQKPIIHRQIDIGHLRRHRAKPLQQSRQLLLGRRLRQESSPSSRYGIFRHSRHHVQIEPSRLVVSTTTPRKPYSRTGSCAGLTSSAIW